MPTICLLTCEHAGFEVPAEYASLFKGKEEVLYSHKAIDFGALRLARHMAQTLALPLYYTTYSRLLIEANRSPDSEELFSEFTKKLPNTEKQRILETYYAPHRAEVERKIRDEIAAGNQVLHLAVHTFTPVLEGKVREAEIGLLFDPARAREEAYAHQLKAELHRQNPARQVFYNSPYPGVDDGFPTYLRQKFSDAQYAGFELEINQKFFLNGEASVWQQLLDEMTSAVKAVLKT
ncbi:N-formylglutamate amidohydrolase [Rufibacter sediminis]|uniref:N-formylglutamate amidohydrolase n=1 Tax=Rufibacter sediminis TaxID=2762756 RepID=A0ABR6VP94_9BACT|nr:N-formylglutamate amidohydrolase [Rufibacter sediminis]MBC3538755.1 N-formylglutamate amidohydrolase [Rufibacter sediminis]